MKDLEAELDELRSTLDALKETLEGETLSKVDLQNSIQSLKEELAFKKKVYEEVRNVVHTNTVQIHIRYRSE